MTTFEPGAAGQRAAAARGEAARRRINELQQRRAELSAGIPSSPDTVEQARQHAIESLERVRQAHRDAAARHVDASVAHRRAAATHEEAALRANGKTVEAHQDSAAVHRAAASIHDAAAIVEGEAEAASSQVWASISSSAPDTPPSGL